MTDAFIWMNKWLNTTFPRNDRWQPQVDLWLNLHLNPQETMTSGATLQALIFRYPEMTQGTPLLWRVYWLYTKHADNINDLTLWTHWYGAEYVNKLGTVGRISSWRLNDPLDGHGNEWRQFMWSLFWWVPSRYSRMWMMKGLVIIQAKFT